MIKDLPTNLRIIFLFLCVFFCANTNVFGQISIGQPTFSFNPACASPGYNSYEVNFNFSPVAGLMATNQFIVELSAPDGSFTNATVVYTSAVGEIMTSPGKMKFPFPTNTAGEKYRLRIKATAPASTGQPSIQFPAYYRVHNSQFTINNFIPVAAFCAGSSYILTIDNPGGPLNDSPLKHSGLTYNWYKNNGLILPETLVATATNGSYTVTQPGVYYARTNYGACILSSDSYSNQVTVSESTTNSSTAITSSLGNPFCPNGGSTTLSVSGGVKIEWFKKDSSGNNVLVSDKPTYDTNVSGLYTVKIDFGGCTANGSINLQSEGSFAASINVPNSNTIDTEINETLNVIVTNDAVAPSYKWYLNGTLIPDAITDTYLINTIGNYKVAVAQTTGCTSTQEFNFVVGDTNSNLKNIPNIVSLSSAFNTWDLPTDYKNAETNVMIVSSQGEVMFNGVDYDPTKWEIKDFKNINPVYYYIIKKGSDEKKGSITVIK
ncbi:gliding motility-associated C-terminal domain-containing protein [Flavobacterium branchiarum]|uniref:Gliding motility-associated C-terminal domain-containing protein n=1 Tax=Flavobacterium branchiarum TaxID=1114870 RepID=A0ABV5FJW3_9FLAO|nr:gliding motility-associated C-terminal domain-containing protein [Flavobacterium branchiarum]MDN3675434.1 gliding motility-associated C-terminal domain-containing protein [Flavobacterium branchiarum]